VIAGIANLLRYTMVHPLGRKQPIRSLARIVQWQVKSRVARGPITHAWVNDSRLIVRRHMVGATGNIYYGLFEFADMAFLLHFLRPDDLFLDIGANVGTYTVLASAVCGAESWAFEPDHTTITNLKANLAANGIDARASIHATALGSEDGEIAFTIGLDTVNRVAENADLPQHLVPVTRLDAVAEEAFPAMIKIDVEGHEEQVLAGAELVLSNASLKAIEIETVTPAVLDQLARHGFIERFYDPFRRVLSDQPLALHANNRLFIRDEAYVAERLQQAPAFRVAGHAI
jgi:FkbM family methyltransferase